MTKELLTDLCARLPYGVKVKLENDYRLYQLLMLHPRNDAAMLGILFEGKDIEESYVAVRVHISDLKPYLRPMSSMTEEEKKRYNQFIYHLEAYSLPNSGGDFVFVDEIRDLQDWLNRKMFDYRGLIERGSALEATEGMYKGEE